MDEDRSATHFKAADPDAFDRAYGQAQGFPKTKPSTVVVANVMGIGGVRSYQVETFRIPDVGDTTFIVITGPEGLQRVHLPPLVTAVVARQRASLADQARRRHGQRLAETRRASGFTPTFTPAMRAKALATRKAKAAKRRARKPR
jgi:hypothetical protein